MLVQYFLKLNLNLIHSGRVEIGSLQQLFPILVAIIFSFLLYRYSKRSLDRQNQERLIHWVAILISLTVISFHVYKISLGGYNIRTDLPFYLCSLLGLIIPVFTYYKKQWMFEVLLFWIIAGTTQAIITPDIPIGFPSFEFFRYWIVHLGLVVLILYFVVVLNHKPTLKSVFKSFLALQIYVIIMLIVNYALDANYFYLNQKPESATLLDHFGDWPMYIIVGQLLLIPYFLLIYLPFHFGKKRFLLSK
jgi:hypothetical integral membrane protein (TIGR02206 family)